MLLMKHKKNQAGKASGNRLLISVTVIGSAGPIRFVVNEEEVVAAVIDTALKSYAREGRLPILGSNINDFVLYCPNAGTEGKNLKVIHLNFTIVRSESESKSKLELKSTADTECKPPSNSS